MMKQREKPTSVIVGLKVDDCGRNTFAGDQRVPVFAQRPTFSQEDGQRGQVRDCYKAGDSIQDPLPLFDGTKNAQQE